MADKSIRFPVLLFQLESNDEEYELGMRFWIETIDLDRFYSRTREQMDLFCVREGLQYINTEEMNKLREQVK